MDLIGDIVEHEVQAPAPPVNDQNNGFPNLGKLRQKKASRWKQKLQEGQTPKSRDAAKHNTQQLQEDQTPKSRDAAKPNTQKAQELTEAEKIHQENMDKIAQLTEAEINEEREELLSGLDPALVKSLLARTEKRLKSDACCDDHGHGHNHAEGYGGWIGGAKDGTSVSHLDPDDVNKALGLSKISLKDDISEDSTTKHEALPTDVEPKKGKNVRFSEIATVKYEDLDDDVKLDENGWEDVEDINDLIPNMPNADNEIAHDDYQLLTEKEELEEEQSPRLKVHFPKPSSKSNDDLDLDDPQFFDKLHEKYFPDLPKETQKLSWMTEPMPTKVTTTYESISDMRFDFKGNLVELDESGKQQEIPTHMGLHHHSDNPNLAGYTLPELARLSRSVVSGQRCFSIQMLGRILHKLGLHKYNILPVSENKEDEAFNSNLKELMGNFETLMWQLIGALQIIESIQEAADEKKTRNLSVRNYAIEALWLWKQGGGREPAKEQPYSEEDLVAREVQG